MNPPLPPLSMLEAARAVGLTYEAFRKRWKRLRRENGFPSPFLEHPYAWRAEAIEAWKANREALLDGRRAQPAAANDAGPAATSREAARVSAARADVLQLMGAR